MTERAHLLGVLTSLSEDFAAHLVETSDAVEEVRTELHVKLERLTQVVLERLELLERAADARHAEVLAALAARERQ